MSNNLKELERRLEEARANMKRTVNGVGTQYTLEEGAAAVRACGEAGKAYQIAKTAEELDTVTESLVSQLHQKYAAMVNVESAIERGRYCDLKLN
jgi:hypothetical protein